MKTRNETSQTKKTNSGFKPAALAITSLMLVLSVIALSASTALAGPRGQRGPSPDRVMNRLSYELNLTEEQRAEVAPIIEAEMLKRQELMEERREKDEALRSQMEASHQEFVSQIADVLNPAQMEKYSEMMERRKKVKEARITLWEEGKGRGMRVAW